jgi:ketosteroid isomerase-like protein
VTTEELVWSYFRCLDTEDWATMETLWHEDGEFHAVGARPRHGRDEVLGLFGRLFTPWARHEDRPTRVSIAGDVVTAEVRFTGTTEDGRAVSFDAVDVIDVRDGRIARISNWYDIDYARQSLAGEGATT